MLKAPDRMNQMDINFGDWIGLYKMDMRKWKLVDVDHYMGGNPYFSSYMTKEQFTKNINDTMGKFEDTKIPVRSMKEYERIYAQ